MCLDIFDLSKNIHFSDWNIEFKATSTLVYAKSFAALGLHVNHTLSLNKDVWIAYGAIKIKLIHIISSVGAVETSRTLSYHTYVWPFLHGKNKTL